MTPQFSWDPQKDKSNTSKHGVTFTEAATTFADPLSLTKSDPDHSWHEERYLTLGQLRSDRLLVVAHSDRGNTIRIISARPASRRERKEYEAGGWIAEMRPEYDFSDGVRGKYADRFSGDCVMVQLDPDVAAAFPDSKAVNETLRALIPESERSGDSAGASAASARAAGLLHRPGAGTVTQAEMDADVLELIAKDDERIRDGR